MPPPPSEPVPFPVALFASASSVPPMVPPLIVTVEGVFDGAPAFCAYIAPPDFASLPVRVQPVISTVAPCAKIAPPPESEPLPLVLQFLMVVFVSFTVPPLPHPIAPPLSAVQSSITQSESSTVLLPEGIRIAPPPMLPARPLPPLSVRFSSLSVLPLSITKMLWAFVLRAPRFAFRMSESAPFLPRIVRFFLISILPPLTLVAFIAPSIMMTSSSFAAATASFSFFHASPELSITTGVFCKKPVLFISHCCVFPLPKSFGVTVNLLCSVTTAPPVSTCVVVL